MKRRWEPVGAHPRVQGYWACVLGDKRPDWHNTHKNKDWIKEWEAGYKERESWEKKRSK